MKNITTLFNRLAGIGLFAFAAPIAGAQLTTIRVEGAVFTDVSSTAAFKSAFPIGTSFPFVASFTYDPAVPDSDAHSYLGSYVGIGFPIYANGAAFNATLDVGSLTFHAGFDTGGTEGMNVYDNAPNFGPSADGFSFTYSAGGAGSLQNGFNVTSFGLVLANTNTAIFGSDLLSNLSSGAWSLSDFPLNQNLAIHPVNFAFSEGWLAGSVSSISVSAIPEPSTYAAFAGFGALGLAAWRRRKQSTR